MNSDVETVEPLIEQKRAISKIWLLPLLIGLLCDFFVETVMVGMVKLSA